MSADEPPGDVDEDRSYTTVSAPPPSLSQGEVIALEVFDVEFEEPSRPRAQEAARRAHEEQLAREARERDEAEQVAREGAAKVAREAAEWDQLTPEIRGDDRRLGDELVRVEQESSERVIGEQILGERFVAEAPPASARQPRDDSRPMDSAPPYPDDEEPPVSGEVSSQRKPAEHHVDLGTPSDIRFVVEEPPPPASLPVALGPVRPLIMEVSAEVVAPPRAEGDPSVFLGAVRADTPPSFGELLDATLALGE